jgi:hypothetical protein
MSLLRNLAHDTFFAGSDEYEDENDSMISLDDASGYDVDGFTFESDDNFGDSVLYGDEEDADRLDLRAPKKRGRKPSNSSGRSRNRRGDDHIRALLEDSANYVNLGVQGRRSRRMRPIDSNKELIVLMPNDDPVSKLQLEKNEIPEFVCCMEEKYDWAAEEEKLEGEGFGKGQGHREHHAGVPVPEGGVVHVPLFRSNENHYRKNSNFPPFSLPGMGTESTGSLYASYELDSEDESFLQSWKAGQPLKILFDEESCSSSDIPKNGIAMKARKGQAVGCGASMPLTSQSFSELLVCLEREYELAKKSMPLRLDIEEAKFKCQEYMNACSALAAEVEEFVMKKDGVASLEKSFSAHQEQAQTWNETKSGRSNSYVSLKSSNDAACSEDGRGSPRHNSSADLMELPVVTRTQLEATLPLTRAFKILNRAYAALLVSESLSKKEPLDETRFRSEFTLIYEYWLYKRSSRRSSLLRCYHDFIMENWKHQEVLPVLVEDRDVDTLLNTHSYLVTLRHDLDRARLIMDRVRRREKVKRELVRVAGDTTDDFLHTLKIAPAESKDVPALKDKGSGKSKFEKAAADQQARKPRAAKSLALVKMDPNASGAAWAATSAPNNDYESDDSNLITFTLEDCDYDNLDIPAHGSAFTSSVAESMPSRDSRSLGLGSNSGYYSDYDPRRVNQRSQARFGSAQQQTSAATGWTADEDRLLLMGVAACGVGRWTEIREDFLLARNSAQMNQRFTRLARRRCVLVKLNAASNKKGANGRSGANDETSEYTEVRTAYMTPQDISHARSKLPPLIIGMLEAYSEDSVWESIAIRHLLDMQSKDKRCGRPQKYPLPIPIPKHLQNGGFLNRRKLIIQRPSELGYSWKGKPTGVVEGSYDYAGGGGSYSRGGYSQSANNSSGSDPNKKRHRGRPRKNSDLDLSESKRSRRSDGDDADPGRGDDDLSISSELSASSDDWKQSQSLSKEQISEQRRLQQDLSREERARAREKNFQSRIERHSSNESGSDDDRLAPAMCSLNSLPSYGEASAKRGRGRPPLSPQTKVPRDKKLSTKKK